MAVTIYDVIDFLDPDQHPEINRMESFVRNIYQGNVHFKVVLEDEASYNNQYYFVGLTGSLVPYNTNKPEYSNKIEGSLQDIQTYYDYWSKNDSSILESKFKELGLPFKRIMWFVN